MSAPRQPSREESAHHARQLLACPAWSEWYRPHWLARQELIKDGVFRGLNLEDDRARQSIERAIIEVRTMRDMLGYPDRAISEIEDDAATNSRGKVRYDDSRI